MPYQPIENYGVIGDPDFDSPTVFAGLLDDRRGGRFRILDRRLTARRRTG